MWLFPTGLMTKLDKGAKRPKYQAVVYTEIAFTTIVLVFIVQLNLYHVWLDHNGITTFDHIVYRRELKVKTQKYKVSFSLTQITFCRMASLPRLNLTYGKSKILLALSVRNQRSYKK